MNDRPPLVSLPGPARHIAALVSCLEAGMSCVWLLPEVLVDTNDADELLYELSAHVETLRVPGPGITEVTPAPRRPVPSPGRPPGPRPAWAVDRFGSTALTPARTDATEPGRTRRANTTIADRLLTLLPDPAPTLADVLVSPELRGKVLVVRAWHELDPALVGATAVQFAAMTKDSRVPPAERVRLLVLARERDISAGSLERLDPVTARVHWWWGAIGRLDTAVTVAAAQPHGGALVRPSFVSDHLFDDVVTEIAGPDLTLAHRLSSSWDGRTATLSSLIDAHVEASGTVAHRTEEWHGRPRTPPRRLREAWNRGLADLWDGEVRLGAAMYRRERVPELVDQYLWRGQNRALTPVIDRLRAGLEHRTRSMVSPAVLETLLAEENPTESGRRPGARPSRQVLELGRMAWAAHTGLIRLGHADRKLLYCLRDVRNALAHLSPLDDDTVNRLANAITTSSVRGHDTFG